MSPVTLFLLPGLDVPVDRVKVTNVTVSQPGLLGLSRRLRKTNKHIHINNNTYKQ